MTSLLWIYQWRKACGRNVHGGAASNSIFIFQTVGQVILEKPNKKGMWGLAWISVGIHALVLSYDRPETGLICFTTLEWRDEAVSSTESSLFLQAAVPFGSCCALCSRAEQRECVLGLTGMLNYVQEQLSGGTRWFELCQRGSNSLQEGGFGTLWAVTAQFRCARSAQMWECAFNSGGAACTTESFSITRKLWSWRRIPV